MKVTAVYRFSTPAAAAIHACLLPETHVPISDRSAIRLSLQGDGVLVLDIESDDVTSMRSATNTWLRLIMTTADVFSVSAPAGCALENYK